MTASYSRDMLKISVAKMLQTLGWNSVNTTPVEIMTDILKSYLCDLGRLTNEFANQYNCTEPNLDHLGLAFRELNVDLGDLEDYIKYVDFGHNPTPVPKYPIPKEDHLNFLKPGSKEVLTRPVHIHEHLPPMSFGPEGEENASGEVKKPSSPEESEDMVVESNPVFKRPIDVSSPNEGLGFTKRAKFTLEEEGRPTRELSSVMMTTSGYLSPAREGKLPESRTPLATVDPIHSTNSINSTQDVSKKSNKVIRSKMDKKKDRIGKELFKPDEVKPKKTPSVKDIAKMKHMKQNVALPPPSWNNILASTSSSTTSTNEIKAPSPQPPPPKTNNNHKINKALQQARLKTEKLNTTITPIPPSKNKEGNNDNIDKLFSEPDKKKVNIFKKISNVKNEKPVIPTQHHHQQSKVKEESRESSPDLVIDESASDSLKMSKIPSDITIELIDVPKVPEKLERSYFDDDSPPGTPSTPKTPEMISQSPPLTGKERRKEKRKDKTKLKKINNKMIQPPTELDTDLERPKTPEAALTMMKPELPIPPMNFPFFNTFNHAPGLIPNNPLFPHLPIPNLPSFGQPPYMAGRMFMPPMVQKSEPEQPQIEEPKPHIQQAQQQTQSLSNSSPSTSTIQPQTNNSPTTYDSTNITTPKPEKKNKEHKKDKKDKVKKKNKKDKNKDKSEKKKLKEEKKDKEKLKKEKKEKRKEKEMRAGESGELGVPKITLKLGSNSPLPPPEQNTERKLNIKPVVKMEEEEEEDIKPTNEIKREMSPELAKISALVTGQPKTKSNQQIPPIISNDSFSSSSTDTLYTSTNTPTNQKKNVFKPIPKIRTKELMKPPDPVDTVDTTPTSYKFKEEIKEEAMVPVVGPPQRSGPGPGRPRIHPIKPKPTKINNKRQLPVKDSEGNEVWICPACGQQDDGSPMIGCDDCDAWYHWFCVGIQVPPDDSENWYCRHCIVKKQEVLQSDKKKKRKKKEKKDH